MRGAAGLRMLHRITEEHLRLTPTHRMKVKLAAQVRILLHVALYSNNRFL